MSDATTELAVIGAGPGGYPAAFRAADLGMKVTLIDVEENPGGVCLYRGCIPSKALLHLASLKHEAREAASMGLTFSEPEIDLNRIRDWKDSVISRLTGGLGGLVKARKIDYIRGRATFSSPQRLHVETVDGASTQLNFKHAILATGSRPTKIPLFPESQRVMDSTGALEMPDVPETLLVVGGGYIGLEMASVYASLGTDVSIVEMLPHLLPGADPDLVKPVAKRMQKQCKSIMLDTRVVEAYETEEGIRVRLEGKQAIAPEMTFDRVLVSVGRRPNSENLGLENTDVRLDERGGFVQVDPQRRTNEASIFAIGDVIGGSMLAHKATHEGLVAAEAAAGKKTSFDPLAIPAVVFTDPEIAWTGLTETEAKKDDIPVEVAKFPWAASGRAMTLERTEGLTKLIVDRETEDGVLGVGITGVHAGEMIGEAVLAIELGATVEDIALTIHPHPTLSETLMEAAEVFHDRSAHFVKRRR